MAHKSKRGSATHSDTHGSVRGLTARRPPSRRSERFSAPGAECFEAFERDGDGA